MAECIIIQSQLIDRRGGVEGAPVMGIVDVLMVMVRV